MNACNPAKFGACIKNRTIQELSRRTNIASTPKEKYITTKKLAWDERRLFVKLLESWTISVMFNQNETSRIEKTHTHMIA